MGVEGDNVFHSHIHQFAQRQRTVQGLSSCSFMLAALIKERHDYVDPSCLACGSGDHTFQVLIMVIGGHMVLHPVQRIGQAVITDINHDIQVLAADGFQNFSFSFTGAKTRCSGTDNVGILLITGKRNRSLVLALSFSPPVGQPCIDFFSESIAALQRDQSQRSDRNRLDLLLFVQHILPPYMHREFHFYVRKSFRLQYLYNTNLPVRQPYLPYPRHTKRRSSPRSGNTLY